MNRARTATFFSFLTLAFSGSALAIAEMDFLPESPILLLIYLAFLWGAWYSAGKWTLPTWGINTLGLLIAGLGSAWIASRLGDTETVLWLRDVPLAVAIVPYLGPMLLGLTLVRVYCPYTPGDFWVIQGLGLLQISLGCVLTSGTLFGVFLLLYLISALCAMAARHLQSETLLSEPTREAQPSRGAAGWLGFSLRWTFAIALVALPLFLITPRAEGPEWDPWNRFGFRSPPTIAKMGFSEEIDLNRVGPLQSDESVAFTVSLFNEQGDPSYLLPLNQRWRGVVLDRYDSKGRWRNSLNWNPIRVATSRLSIDNLETMRVAFRVPGRSGGLFLADPVILGPIPNALPISQIALGRESKAQSLFHEYAGTAIPLIPSSYLTRKEYRYVQSVPLSNQDRYRAWRTQSEYLQKLVENRLPELTPWTRSLIGQIIEHDPRRRQLFRELQGWVNSDEPLPHRYWEIAARILSDHLAYSGEYGYSTNYARENQTTDPVVEFLMNVREGPCERFATGLALMLRSIGIPSRVVKGFLGAEEVGDGVYEIRNHHAHAWVEALVLSNESDQLSYDWLSLDPTPGSARSERRPSAFSRLWQLQQSGQALWQDLIVGYGATKQADLWNELIESGRWKIVALWLLCPSAMLLAFWFWRRRNNQKTSTTGLQQTYEELIALLSTKLNLAPQPQDTPLELADRAAKVILESESLQSWSTFPRDLVAQLYEVRYGNRTIAEETHSRLRERLSQLRSALAG